MQEPIADIGTASFPDTALQIPPAPSWVWDVLCCFFSFSGRLGLGSYWAVIATSSLVLLLAFHVSDVPIIGQVVLPLLVIAWLVTFAAASVKRANDIREPECSVPLVVMPESALLFIAFGRGLPEANVFGAPPPGWMRIGRRRAGEMAEAAQPDEPLLPHAFEPEPESIALARTLTRTHYVDDAKSLIRHIGGTVAYQDREGGILLQAYKVSVVLFGRSRYFDSEHDMVRWVLAEIVPAILNRPVPNPVA